MKASNTDRRRYASTYADKDYDTSSSGQRWQRVVVIDVETTGLDPEKHEILEIGAVREDGATFEQMVQIRHPERIQFEAAKINQCHLWHPDCFEEPPVNSVLPYADRAIDMLLDWLDSYDPTSRWTVIGRNPRFDLGFLFAHGPENLRAQRRLYKYGLDLHDLVNWALCIGAHDPLRLSKDEKYAVLGYQREPIPHRAIQGAEMEWKQMHSAFFMIRSTTLELIKPFRRLWNLLSRLMFRNLSRLRRASQWRKAECSSRSFTTKS